MQNNSPFAHVPATPAHYADQAFDVGNFDSDSKSIDLRKILAVARANLLLFGLIVFACLAIALAVTLLQTPRYTATATVQINNQSAQVLADQQDTTQSDAVSPQETERFLQTQMDILNSRALAERVAQRLRLIGNPKFYAGMGMPAPKAELSQRVLHENTLNILLRAVKTELPANSRLAKINFTSVDPQLAAQISNAWANEFIQANLQRRYDSSAYARDFISGQLVEAKVKLEQSERDLNAYARKAGLIRSLDSSSSSGSGQSQASVGGNSVTTASLVQINSAANQAEAVRIALEQRWSTMQKGRLLDSPEVLGNSTVAQLLSARAKAMADLQSERAKHLEDHPVVQQLKAQVSTIDAQISTLAQNIRNALKQQYDAAVQAENSLNDQVSKLKGSSLAEQDLSVQYNLLAREADTNRSLYDGLLQRYKELNAAAGISASNIAIIDAADVPTDPSSPNLLINMAAALVLGIAIAALAVLIRYQFDDAVRVPEDVEEKLGVPLLGVIPKSDDTTPAQAMVDPKSMVSEGYNSLRSALLYSTPGGLPKTLLVTSSQPSEGKSTTCYAMAQGFARVGRKVVLLDVDLRRPAMHAVIGVKNDIGMSGLLTNQNTLDEVMRPTEFENLSVITSGPLAPSPTELLSSGRLQQVLQEMSERFDVIILDSPPVLGLADAPLMSALVDGVVLVVQSDRNRGGSLKASLRRLRAMHPNILGAVLTMFDTTKVGYRYSEYYGYNYYRYSPELED